MNPVWIGLEREFHPLEINIENMIILSHLENFVGQRTPRKKKKQQIYICGQIRKQKRGGGRGKRSKFVLICCKRSKLVLICCELSFLFSSSRKETPVDFSRLSIKSLLKIWLRSITPDMCRSVEIFWDRELSKSH